MSQLETNKEPKPIHINVLSRDETRKFSLGYSRQAIFVPLDSIIMSPIGNWRKKTPYQTEDEFMDSLNIPELAEQIYANNGPADPLEGDILADTKEFALIEGQRRWLAIRYLIFQGKTNYPNGNAINKVEVLCQYKNTSILERAKKNFTSNNKLPLKPSQTAAGFLHFKENNLKDAGTPEERKFTNQEIAEMFGVSRQYIDNMLKINELDADTLRKLDDGSITQTAALATIRKQREPKEPKEPITENKTTIPSESKDVLTDEHIRSIFNINPDNETVSTSDTWSAAQIQQIEELGYNINAVIQLYKKVEEEPETEETATTLNVIDKITAAKIFKLHGDIIPTSDTWTEEQCAELVTLGYDIEALKDAYRPAVENPTVIETNAAIQAEEEARKTSDKITEQVNTERAEAKKAMEGIDYRPDKIEGEMLLNECMANLDKLSVKISQLPAHLKPHADDMESLCHWTRTKITDVQAILKKASDER